MNRPLPKRKNKEVVSVMEDELVGKIIEEFVRIRVKTYRYLIDDGSENKTAKDTKRCNIKKQLKFEDCKNCLEET